MLSFLAPAFVVRAGKVYQCMGRQVLCEKVPHRCSALSFDRPLMRTGLAIISITRISASTFDKSSKSSTCESSWEGMDAAARVLTSVIRSKWR